MSNNSMDHSEPARPTSPSVRPEGVGLEELLHSPAARSWHDLFMPFVARHGDWWNKNGSCEPIYTLPGDVVEALAKGEPTSLRRRRRARRPLIAEQDVLAETAFLSACEEFGDEIVGVWMGVPIRYSLLNAVSGIPKFSDNMIAWYCERNKVSRRDFDKDFDYLKNKLDRMNHQLLGYVGRLTFNDQYRDELRILRAQWDLLPEKPLLDVGSAQLLGASPAFALESVNTSRTVPFYSDYAKFIKKWQLIGLVTWDLPLPQGSLQHCPAGLVASLRGPDTSVNHHPGYYDIPSNDNVRQEIRKQQRHEGKSVGVELEFPVTDTSPRAGSPSEFEAAYRMWLIEGTVRRRYGDVRGVVSRLLDVFSRLFKISKDRSKKVRSLYLQYLPQ